MNYRDQIYWKNVVFQPEVWIQQAQYLSSNSKTWMNGWEACRIFLYSVGRCVFSLHVRANRQRQRHSTHTFSFCVKVFGLRDFRFPSEAVTVANGKQKSDNKKKKKLKRGGRKRNVEKPTLVPSTLRITVKTERSEMWKRSTWDIEIARISRANLNALFEMKFFLGWFLRFCLRSKIDICSHCTVFFSF